MTTCLGKSCSFGLPRVPFVNCRQFMYLVIFPFGFEGRMWDLIVSVPDHCLSFYIPRARSQGELISCSIPKCPPILSSPCLPVPASVDTQCDVRSIRTKWAASWQNQQNGMCAQRRLRSAWDAKKWPKVSSCGQQGLWSDWAELRLIWVFAGRTGNFVCFVMGRLKCYSNEPKFSDQIRV